MQYVPRRSSQYVSRVYWATGISQLYALILIGWRKLYHAAMTADLKEKVIQSFCTINSKLRLLWDHCLWIGHTDCPDILRVYHWGLPSDLDSYVLESGRVGRDHQLYKWFYIAVWEVVTLHQCEDEELCWNCTMQKSYITSGFPIDEDVQSISAVVVLSATFQTLCCIFAVEWPTDFKLEEINSPTKGRLYILASNWHCI